MIEEKYPDSWDVVKLGDEKKFEIYMGQSPPSTTYNQNNQGLAFLQGTSEFGNIFPNSTIFCSKPIRLAKEGDILISVRAPVGEINLANKDYCIGRGISALRAKSLVYNQFIFYYLKFARKKFEAISSGSTFQAVRKSEIENFKILLPPLKEQQKIANILTVVDETIEETNNIIESCKKIKKGIMQTLLVKGLPGKHIKFKTTKIGEVPEDWKYCKFKDVVLSFKNGGTPSTKVKSYWEGNVPWVTGADFSDGKIIAFRKFINENAVKNSATNVIPKGNLLLVTRTGVGKLAIAHTDIAISQDVTGIVLSEDVDTHYAYWYFLKNIKNLKSLNQGTSINGIIRSDLENFIFIYPDKKEQQEIVSILSIFVDRMEAEKSKKSQLEILKKGLMQKLLTGEVRVKVN